VRLLVSVRSPDEVAAAIEGGADIVDAKEPSRGSLGPVAPAVLLGIVDALPAGMPLSAALGDVTSAAQAAEALEPFRGIPLDYLKLGFAGARSAVAMGEAMAVAAELSRTLPHRPRLVIVAYADAAVAETPPAETVARLAWRHGAAGVLLDTWRKDGRDLFEWMTPPSLRSWVAMARESGLETAVAGSLRAGHLAGVREARPDIVGVRGAACAGGRAGSVQADLVAALRHELFTQTTLPQLVKA
jgi:uncharacterized protein (UPF0264 family)